MTLARLEAWRHVGIQDATLHEALPLARQALIRPEVRESLVTALDIAPDRATPVLEALAGKDPVRRGAALAACGLNELAAVTTKIHVRDLELRPIGSLRRKLESPPKPLVEHILRLFAGNTACHAKERLNARGQVLFARIDSPLDTAIVSSHLAAGWRAASFAVLPGSKVSFSVIAVSLSKQAEVDMRMAIRGNRRIRRWSTP